MQPIQSTHDSKQVKIPRLLMVLAFLAIAAICVYGPALHGPFMLDDHLDITNNSHIQISGLTLDALMEAGFESKCCSQRPFSNITFAVGYLVHGLNPFWFRVVNIFIHILSAFFLFFLFKTTLNLPGLASRHGIGDFAPFFAALIFLVHPVQTQAVSYIVQRMTSMAAMFYVLSLLLYVHARIAAGKKIRLILFGFCGFSFLFAAASKEIAATLPIIILLYEWFFLQDLSKRWFLRNLWKFVMIGALTGMVALIYLNFDPKEIFAYYSIRDFTPGQRMLTQLRVVVFYMGLLVLPLPGRMNLDHDFLVSTGIFSPLSTFVCAMILAGLLVWAVLNAKKHRLVSFCVFWFFINLAIESSIIGLELVFEHRLYLSSMFLCLLPVLGVRCFLKKARAATLVLCCVIVALGILTYQRNQLWGDGVALWRDSIKKSPQKVRLYNHLGYHLLAKGRVAEAVKAVETGIRIGSERLDDKSLATFKALMAEMHNNLGYGLELQGKTEQAIAHYKEAVRIRPNYLEAANNLGVILTSAGRTDEAVFYYETAIKINPLYFGVHLDLADVLAGMGKLDKALVHYRLALDLDPGNARVHQGLANVLARMQKEKCLKNTGFKQNKSVPASSDANNMGMAYMQKNEIAQARTCFEKAIELNSESIPAHYNMACVYARQNKVKESESWLKKAVNLGFDNLDLLKNDKDMENIRQTRYYIKLTGENNGK